MATFTEELPKEIERVKDIIKGYENLSITPMPVICNIEILKTVILIAEKTLSSGDSVLMQRSYEYLKEVK